MEEHLLKDRKAERALVVVFAITLAITAAAHIWTAGRKYTYHHALISTTFATCARTFAGSGLFKLHFIPDLNNPPIGPSDGYTHWPPMTSALLSVCFRVFGTSETVGHLWALAIEVTTALLVFTIACNWLGRPGGALAGAFWLVMPVTVHYGHVILAESLALALMLGAVLAVQRSRPGYAAGFVVLAVWSSWEAVLLAPALWAVAWKTKRPEHRRAASLCTVSIIGAFASVMVLYALANPVMFCDTIQTALFRMGLSKVYSNQVIGVNTLDPAIGFDAIVSRLAVNFPRMLGIFGAAALISLGLARPRGSELVFYGTGIPWMLWCVLMPNHAGAHDIEMLLAAPVASIALAWFAIGVAAKIGGRPTMKLAGGIVFAAALVSQPWIFGTDPPFESPPQMLGFAEKIRSATESDAVVLSPLISTIPLYYSERHIIRCISDLNTAQSLIPSLRKEFPRARFYWVTPLESHPWAEVKEID